MKNVDIKVEGAVLTIAVDLSRTFGSSKSGKSIVIASTEGNEQVATAQGVVAVGVNVYRKV